MGPGRVCFISKGLIEKKKNKNKNKINNSNKQITKTKEKLRQPSNHQNPQKNISIQRSFNNEIQKLLKQNNIKSKRNKRRRKTRGFNPSVGKVKQEQDQQQQQENNKNKRKATTTKQSSKPTKKIFQFKHHSTTKYKSF